MASNIFQPNIGVGPDFAAPDASALVRSGQIKGEVAAARGKQVGELIQFAGEQAKAADIGATEARLEKEVTATVNETLTDSGLMGGGPQVNPAQTPEQVLEFERKIARLRSAGPDGAGILSGTQANARITQAVKEATARWPGLAAEFRQAAASATERALYGDAKVYGMLVDESARARQAAARAKENEDIRTFQRDNNIQSFELAKLEWQKDHIMKRSLDTLETQNKIKQQQNLLKDTDVVAEFDTRHSVAKLELRRTLSKIVEQARSLGVSAEDAQKAAEFDKQALIQITGAERQANADLDSLVASRVLSGAKADELRPKIAAEYEFMKKNANLKTMSLFKEYADTIATNTQLVKNQQSLLSPQDEYFRDKDILRNSYMLAQQQMIASQIDPTVPDVDLRPEQKAKRDAILKNNAISPETYAYTQTLAVAQNNKQGEFVANQRKVALFHPDGSPKSVAELKDQAASGDQLARGALNDSRLMAKRLTADSEPTGENIRAVAVLAEDLRDRMQAPVEPPRSWNEKTQGKYDSGAYIVSAAKQASNAMKFVDKLPEDVKNSFYLNVTEAAASTLFGDGTYSVSGKLAQMVEEPSPGLMEGLSRSLTKGAALPQVSEYRKDFEVLYNPTTNKLEAAPKDRVDVSLNFSSRKKDLDNVLSKANALLDVLAQVKGKTTAKYEVSDMAQALVTSFNTGVKVSTWGKPEDSIGVPMSEFSGANWEGK